MSESKGNGAAIEYVESHRGLAERDEKSRKKCESVTHPEERT